MNDDLIEVLKKVQELLDMSAVDYARKGPVTAELGDDGIVYLIDADGVMFAMMSQKAYQGIRSKFDEVGEG